MTETMWTAFMSLLGTLVGTVSGILASNRLTAYRLRQLEEKVKCHNNLIERTYRLEARADMAEQEIRTLKEECRHD